MNARILPLIRFAPSFQTVLAHFFIEKASLDAEQSRGLQLASFGFGEWRSECSGG